MAEAETWGLDTGHPWWPTGRALTCVHGDDAYSFPRHVVHDSHRVSWVAVHSARRVLPPGQSEHWTQTRSLVGVGATAWNSLPSHVVYGVHSRLLKGPAGSLSHSPSLHRRRLLQVRSEVRVGALLSYSWVARHSVSGAHWRSR